MKWHVTWNFENKMRVKNCFRSVLLIGALLTPRLTAAGDIFTDPQASDTPALVQSFDDPNLQQGASNALLAIGQPAVTELMAALSSASPNVQIWSAYTLGRIGSEASAAASLLAATMSAGDSNLRAVTARSLGQIGTADETIVEALALALTNDDPRVREWSAIALGEIGEAAKDAVPALIVALNDQPIRAEAVEAVVQIGAAAVPSLIAALEDDSIRLEASEALRRIDLEAARESEVATSTAADLPSLRMALENTDRDADARIDAAARLGQLGADAAPILVAALDDDDQDVGQAAAAALGEIGSDAVPLLQEALKDDSAAVRARSADALAAVGPDAHVAMEELIAVLEDPDRPVRHRAVNALGELGPGTDEAVPALIAVMQNPRDREETRSLALRILARTGPDVRETVIAALRESSEDDNYGIRTLAERILKKLAPELENG